MRVRRCLRSPFPQQRLPTPLTLSLRPIAAIDERSRREEAEAEEKRQAVRRSLLGQIARTRCGRATTARSSTGKARVKKEKMMEWDGPFESRRGVARGTSRMGLHYSGDEEGYNLCTSSDTEWDRPEEHTSFRRREREVRRRVPGATDVSTDSSDFSPRSSDSEDSDPPVKDEIGDVFPWERVEEEDDVVPRYKGRVNLCTTDDETYTGRTWGVLLPSGLSPLVAAKPWCGGCVSKLGSGATRAFLVAVRAEEEEKIWRRLEKGNCLPLYCMLFFYAFVCTLFARFFSSSSLSQHKT